MPSYQIALSPTKRAAGRFILAVRRAMQKAFTEEHERRGITQSDIAREIGVHRSVINRELRGEKDLTLGRVAEFARVLGRRAVISFPEIQLHQGQVYPQVNAFHYEKPPQPPVTRSSRAGGTGQSVMMEAA